MISVQILVIGQVQGEGNALLAYLRSRNLEYSQSPIEQSIHKIEMRGDAVALLCVDCSHEDHAVSRLKELMTLGVACVALSDACSPGFKIAAMTHRVVRVLEMPLDAGILDEALDVAVYRAELGLAQAAVPDMARQLSELSDRERRIVHLAAEGAPNKQIAKIIGLSVKSIERIRRDAYRKLGVRSTAEMTRVVLLGSLLENLGPGDSLAGYA